MANEAHAEAGDEAGVDAIWILHCDALLLVKAVVAIAKVALGRGVHFVVPRVRVQGDASPEKRERESNDQPAILWVNRVIHIPTEL